MKPAVASGTMRMALRDLVIGGGRYQIPARTGLWLPSYTMHNSKANWGPDAEEYRPVSKIANLRTLYLLCESCSHSACKPWTSSPGGE